MTIRKKSEFSKIKIAIVGSHYVGKTILSKRLYDNYSQKGFNIGVLREVVRDCPYPVNEIATIRSQNWILAEQKKREIESLQTHDILLTDRGLIDNFAYWFSIAAKNNIHKDTISKAELEVFEYSKSYDAILFIQPFQIDEIKSDNFRSVNLKWRKEMHGRVSEILKRFRESYSVPIFSLEGNENQVFEQVKKILENDLHLK